MRIKSGVWYGLAISSFGVGFLCALGLEGTMQVTGATPDNTAGAAIILLLLAGAFMELGFAAETYEKRRQNRCGK